MSSLGLIEGPSFVTGETDTDRDYAVTQDGKPFDLTGYTAKLYARGFTSGTVLGAIDGSVVSPSTGGVVRINHDTIAALAPEECRAQLELIHATAGTRRLPRDIRIPVRAKVEA